MAGRAAGAIGRLVGHGQPDPHGWACATGGSTAPEPEAGHAGRGRSLFAFPFLFRGMLSPFLMLFRGMLSPFLMPFRGMLSLFLTFWELQPASEGQIDTDLARIT